MQTLRNKVSLIGHLGATPEIKVLEGDKKVTRVSLATNDTFKSKDGEKINHTTWHTLVFWNALADVVGKYTQKGSEIAVEGKLVNRSYTDKEGVKRYTTEIHINDLLLLGSKGAAPEVKQEEDKFLNGE